jgi:hypothetical protein
MVINTIKTQSDMYFTSSRGLICTYRSPNTCIGTTGGSPAQLDTKLMLASRLPVALIACRQVWLRYYVIGL